MPLEQKVTFQEFRPEGPWALPLPCAWVSAKHLWKVHQGLYLWRQSQELVSVKVVCVGSNCNVCVGDPHF